MLTDADREALGRTHTLMQHSTTSDRDEAIYLAGLRAGMERAACACENRTCGSPYPLHLEGQVAACKALAAAIRALRDA